MPFQAETMGGALLDLFQGICDTIAEGLTPHPAERQRIPSSHVPFAGNFLNACVLLFVFCPPAPDMEMKVPGVGMDPDDDWEMMQDDLDLEFEVPRVSWKSHPIHRCSRFSFSSCLSLGRRRRSCSATQTAAVV